MRTLKWAGVRARSGTGQADLLAQAVVEGCPYRTWPLNGSQDVVSQILSGYCALALVVQGNQEHRGVIVGHTLYMGLSSIWRTVSGILASSKTSAEDRPADVLWGQIKRQGQLSGRAHPVLDT